MRSLIDVLDGGHYDLRAEGDDWSVRDQVAHVAAVDLVATEMADALDGSEMALAPLLALREPRRLEVLAHPAGVMEAADKARAMFIERLPRLDPAHLSTEVVLPATDAWTSLVRMQLRTYLAAWAGHDSHHEASIRLAVRNTISPAALAWAARARR